MSLSMEIQGYLYFYWSQITITDKNDVKIIINLYSQTLLIINHDSPG
jgi:hypothetical protein